MTYRHTFTPCTASGPEGSPSEDEAAGGAPVEAVGALRSALDGGLVFYWVLAEATSVVARGGGVQLTYGDSGHWPKGETSPGDDRLSGWRSSSPDPTATVPVSLEVDSIEGERDGVDAGSPAAMDDFVRWAAPFVRAEQSRRAIRHAGAATRALEIQAAHDLRALLQPLMLHVDQLKRNGSHSPGELELLDDLTRAIVEWIEDELESGRLRDRTRNPTGSGDASTDTRNALEEARMEESPRGLEVSIEDELPELSIDRSHLVAGLRELMRLGRHTSRRLRVERSGRSVSIGVSFLEEPPIDDREAAGGDDHEYPPVRGGLLGLTASTGATIRVTRGVDLHGRIDVELPPGTRRASRGLSD